MLGSYAPGRSEVIDVKSSKPCKTIAKYPLRVWRTAGDVLDHKVVICGGSNFDTRSLDHNSCYAHDPDTNTWNLFARMRTERSSHSAVAVQDGLWVTGGWGGNRGRLEWFRSTESIFLNGSVVQGVDLPSARSGHCTVDLRDGRVMLIGGCENPLATLKEVLVYHLSNRSFTFAPSLNEDRGDHACTLFKSVRYNHRPVILVAGGVRRRSVEVLDFTVPGAIWQTSENCFSFNF